MKVLFLNISCINSRYFPTGPAILISILKNKGAKVFLFDTNFIYIKDRSYNLKYISLSNKIGQNKKVEDNKEYVTQMYFSALISKLQKKIDKVKPSLIAISVLSPSYPLLVELMRSIRVPDGCKVAIGGAHCKVAAEEVIKEGCFDYVFEFEAEVSFSMLYEYLKGNKRVSIEMIDGMYWKKEDGSIVYNKLERLPDLSEVPNVDISGFDKKYFMRPYDGRLRKIINYEASRGCSYACTYCINGMIYNKKSLCGYYRRKSIIQIIRELTFLVKRYGFEMIVFMDESFLNRPIEELKGLADSYRKHIGLPFTISTRPETIDEKKIKILKKMNCVSVSIGVESGNQVIRNKILNRKMSNEQIIQAFDLLNRHKIRNSSLNMIGIPTETEDDIWDTIRLNRRLNPSTITVSILYPYKGTPVRDLCLKEGYLNKDKSGDLVNPICSSVLELPMLNRDKIAYYYENFIRLCREKYEN